MPEMYIKRRDGVPYMYRYGEVDAATRLWLNGGYKTPDEAIKAYEREHEEKS